MTRSSTVAKPSTASGATISHPVGSEEEDDEAFLADFFLPLSIRLRSVERSAAAEAAETKRIARTALMSFMVVVVVVVVVANAVKILLVRECFLANFCESFGSTNKQRWHFPLKNGVLDGQCLSAVSGTACKMLFWDMQCP